MAKAINDYGPYFQVFETDDWGDYALLDTVYKDDSGTWLDIAEDYMANGFTVIKTTSIPSPFPNLWDIVSGDRAGETAIASPSYVAPAEVTYATSEDYYESPQWQAVQQANDAYQSTIAVMNELEAEIAVSGMTPELNDAWNAAGHQQQIALNAYQSIGPATPETVAIAHAQTATIAASNAVDSAATVIPEITQILPSISSPERVSSTPLILTLAGLWAAFGR